MKSWGRLAGVRDALLIAGAGVAVFAAVHRLNGLTQTQGESLQFDADVTLAIAGLAAALCFMVALYVVRRVQDLRLERSRRRQAALSNGEQARRLSMVFDNISQGILMFDADKKLVVCNDYYLRMYNLSADIVKPGASLLEIFRHRVERCNLKRSAEGYCADTLRRYEKHEIDRRIVETEDGREIAITDYPTADGGWVSTHEDRTEIRRREESFRLLFENNPVAMWLFDSETLKFIAVNDAAIASYGYSREQFMTMTAVDTRAGDPVAAEATLRALPDIQNNHNVVLHRRADGSTFPVAICSRFMDYEGRKVRLAAVTDISAQTMAENELRRTKKFLNTVIESVPMPIVVKNVTNGASCWSTRRVRTCTAIAAKTSSARRFSTFSRRNAPARSRLRMPNVSPMKAARRFRITRFPPPRATG